MKVVLVTGTVGVGKSTVGFSAARRAADRGVPAGFIDVDELSRYWPAPAGDPFREELVYANLRSLIPNYRASGAALLVLAWVIDDAADLVRLESALDAPVTALRLISPAAVVEARLRSRHQGPAAEGLAWHLDRAPELASIQNALAMPTIDADRPVDSIVDDVLRTVLNAPEHQSGPSATP